MFLSPTHRLIKDREFLILSPLKKTSQEEEFILKKNDSGFKSESLNLKIDLISGGLSSIKNRSSAIAYLDFVKLDFPLKIRKWKGGDFFHPLGMKGKKKLSDFFIDQKIPINEKENVYVLESDGRIAWVINHRIDDRFKVLHGTKKMLKIESVT